MSQKKVDEYKEYKKNREKILKKEKTMQKLTMALVAVLCVVFLGWFGYSIYNSATRPDPDADDTTYTVVDFGSYTDYMNGLDTTY